MLLDTDELEALDPADDADGAILQAEAIENRDEARKAQVRERLARAKPRKPGGIRLARGVR